MARLQVYRCSSTCVRRVSSIHPAIVTTKTIFKPRRICAVLFCSSHCSVTPSDVFLFFSKLIGSSIPGLGFVFSGMDVRIKGGSLCSSSYQIDPIYSRRKRSRPMRRPRPYLVLPCLTLSYLVLPCLTLSYLVPFASS